MEDEGKIIVRVNRRMSQPAEKVFDAWLNPDLVRRWMSASGNMQNMQRVEIDARVGGVYHFDDLRDGELVEHTGEYLEINRPRRLVFTFGIPPELGDRVTVEIEPLEDGCELTLTHEMKPKWADYKERTQSGWAQLIEGLARTI